MPSPNAPLIVHPSALDEAVGSLVSTTRRATTPPAAVASYFATKLAVETDASDVYAAQKAGERFVLVDVRSREAWDQGHVRGAVHMPYREIPARAGAEIPPDTAVVVYCWSPGCNAGAKGALAFAQLGYDVREMIGGYEYWAREGQPTEGVDGALPRLRDPLVGVVRRPS